MEASTVIAIVSMILTIASMIWVGGFRFSALIHEVKGLGARVDKLEDTMNKRFERLENRMDKFETRMDTFQTEMHKFDIRVNTLEQRKP